MSNAGDVLQVEGINAKGYGIIPKLVMQDKRLTATAKAIYAYFCSYAGAGRTAFPSRVKITSDLDIGTKAYYKHLNLLKQCGFIVAEQERIGGKYVRNIYTLPEVVPCSQNDHTTPCGQIAYTPEAHTQKDYSNNNSPKSNNINNNRSSLSCRESFPQYVENITPEVIQDMVDVVHSTIEYEYFQRNSQYDLGLIDEVVAIIVDAMLSNDSTIRLDGENKPRMLVKQRLMELDADCVKHVIETFQRRTESIKRKRQYLLTMLYNSKLELEAHYTNVVGCTYPDLQSTNKKNATNGDK